MNRTEMSAALCRHSDATRCAERSVGLARDGFALVLVLVALAVLTAVASAAMASAWGQLRAATEAGGAVGGRTAALAGIEAALASARGAPPSAVGDSASTLLDTIFGTGGEQTVLGLRLSNEFHLLVAAASVDEGSATRAARVAWWMDPAMRVAGHRAVVESASLNLPAGAVVRGDAVLDDRPGAAGCVAVAALAAAFGAGPLPADGALPGPPEWGAGQAGADHARLRLGWFGRSVLAALADRTVSPGAATPASACTGCWSGLVFAEGDAAVSTSGAGVLAVNGSVTVSAGASWSGLILAAGDVRVEAAAAVVGLVRAGGSVALDANARIDGSACAAYHALAAADSLARPIALPGRSWLGPLSPTSR